MSSDKVLRFEYRGAPQTIGLMRDAALSSEDHYSVRRIAEQICHELDSKDYTSEYIAIYRWVLANTRYMRDPRTVELVRQPHVIAATFARGERPNLDCDDLAILLAALILSVGGKVQFVTVAFKHMFHNGERQYSHVFVRAQDPRTGLWIVLDPVAAEKTNQMLRRVVAARVWPIA